MFGVTTPLVTALASKLRSKFEPLVFHATGVGGRSMERLVTEGELVAVLDMTTTEIADHLVGGVLSAGPTRLDAIIASKIPYVGSLGALDMVNFGAPETVPEKFRDRTLYAHNPFVTLMRTSADECAEIGRWIAAKLNQCEGPLRFLIPTGGISAIDQPGQAFYEPQAKEALFESLETTFVPAADRRLERVDAHINDAAFAEIVMEKLAQVLDTL